MSEPDLDLVDGVREVSPAWQHRRHRLALNGWVQIERVSRLEAVAQWQVVRERLGPDEAERAEGRTSFTSTDRTSP
jgi:hypothetical protein